MTDTKAMKEAKARANEERAEKAFRVMQKYASLSGGGDESSLRDLLTDLMHYAKQQAVDFAREYAMAQMYYNGEK